MFSSRLYQLNSVIGRNFVPWGRRSMALTVKRPRPLPLLAANRRFLSHRHYSSDVGDLKSEDKLETDTSVSSTGVIDVNTSEVVLYFDHIYPLSVSKLSLVSYFRWILQFQKYYDDRQIKDRVLHLANTKHSRLPAGATIQELIPVKRDGGAFIKFSVPPEITAKELISQICDNIKANEKNEDWFDRFTNKIWNHYPKCFQVKGTPWIEDLRRFPSALLKVAFEGEPLTEEELYFLFRRYGMIVDIQPKTSTQAHAVVIFRNVRSAISAKNCITGIKLNKGKTSLHLQYIPVKRVNYIANFIVDHQRISVPAILALLATAAVFIFDPIREWFIEEKISHRYSFETYKDNRFIQLFYVPYQNLKRFVNKGYDYIDDKIIKDCDKAKELSKSLTNFSGDLNDDDGDFSSDSNILWTERFEKVKQLKLWIYENVNTFIVVKGPKGSGKQEFVLDHTFSQDDDMKLKVLYIDCDSLVKARSDNALLQNAAHQLGYFPLFTWTNSISQFIDLGVQGITGQKSGLSESKETQMKNMLSLTTQALRTVALKDYSKYTNGVLKSRRRKERSKAKQEDTTASGIVIEDEILKEDQYLQQHPENKPIIVINKYLLKSDSNHDFVYKMIAEWTSQVVQSNLAHVIYITHDVGSIQHLTDALPNQVFKTISLSDATKKSSYQYVLNQLANSEFKKSAVDACLEPIGGRMLDLQAFIRRIKSGETPDDALEEMVNQAAEQITTFFLNKSNGSDVENNWNSAQVWAIMKILAEKEEIRYTDLTKSPLFKSSSETLSTLATLEKHDLVSLSRDKGILLNIATGRPLYRAAFKNLVSDDNIFKIYESDYYTNLIQLENSKIAKFEDEIAKISALQDLKLLKTRLEYIQAKVVASTEKIVEYEEKIKTVCSKQSKQDSGFLSKLSFSS
ncbi:mitochondrial escape protein 2 [[Candida] anglica]|uniref:Mitochondrial escape protein 2 n=1 Tax=[Candida] anglica TaxID=148631 RepID=A0ABP0EDJ6_9ASCO